MSCHITSRHVTSSHVTSRHVTSRHVVSYHVASWHVTCNVTSSHFQSDQSGHVASRRFSLKRKDCQSYLFFFLLPFSLFRSPPPAAVGDISNGSSSFIDRRQSHGKRCRRTKCRRSASIFRRDLSDFTYQLRATVPRIRPCFHRNSARACSRWHVKSWFPHCKWWSDPPVWTSLQVWLVWLFSLVNSDKYALLKRRGNKAQRG